MVHSVEAANYPRCVAKSKSRKALTQIPHNSRFEFSCQKAISDWQTVLALHASSETDEFVLWWAGIRLKKNQNVYQFTSQSLSCDKKVIWYFETMEDSFPRSRCRIFGVVWTSWIALVRLDHQNEPFNRNQRTTSHVFDNST